LKKQTDPRHQARRIAAQTLFEWIFHNDSQLDIRLKLVLEEEFNKEDIDGSSAKHDQELLVNIIQGVKEHKEELDDIVSKCAPEWPINQIAKTDLSILRISIFELLYLDKTPIKVAIDEAVELAKEFGGNNSSKFINGVLGTVVKDFVSEDRKKADEERSNPKEEKNEKKVKTTGRDEKNKKDAEK